jgi:hypothetical protein
MRRTLLVLLLTSILLAGTASPAEANHGPWVTHFNYVGARWSNMTAKTCIEDWANTVHAAGRSKYVSRAVVEINATASRSYYRYGKGSCAGTGYTQRVILVDDYDGKNGVWGFPDWGPVCSKSGQRHCIRFGLTNHGHWTWLFTNYVVVRLNLSYGVPNSSHFWLHEIGHVQLSIKDRPTWSSGRITCQSVFAFCYPGSSWTHLGSDTDIRWFDAIRKQ